MTLKLKKIGGKMYRALKVGETISKSDVDSYGYPSDYIGYEMDSYTLPIYRPIKTPAKKGKVAPVKKPRVKSVRCYAYICGGVFAIRRFKSDPIFNQCPKDRMVAGTFTFIPKGRKS